MALTNAYVQVYGQLPEIFQRVSDAAAPDKFTNQHLKDWGYTSSNFRAVIPLLKALGFLSADGAPTSRYHDYRGAHPRKVGFVDFGQLASIILENWKHFEALMPSQHWLKQRMDELEKARNFIAHNRMLLPSEFQRIYMYIADWNRVIGL